MTERELPWWEIPVEERIKAQALNILRERLPHSITLITKYTRCQTPGSYDEYIAAKERAAKTYEWLMQNIRPTKRYLEQAGRIVEKHMAERKQLAETIMSAEKLEVPYRNLVYPEYAVVYMPGGVGMNLRELLYHLGMPSRRLEEVYENQVVEGQGQFTGRFAPGGKQKLAEILGKPLCFYHTGVDGVHELITPGSQQMISPTPVE